MADINYPVANKTTVEGALAGLATNKVSKEDIVDDLMGDLTGKVASAEAVKEVADAIPLNSDSMQEGNDNLFFTNDRVAAAPAVTGLGTQITELGTQITEHTTQLSQLENVNYAIEFLDFTDYNFTIGSYVSTSGVITTNANFRYSEPIAVAAGEEIDYSIKILQNVTPCICAYTSDNNFVLSASVSNDGTATSNGSVVTASGIYVVPENITSIRIVRYTTSTAAADTIAIPAEYSVIEKHTDDISAVNLRIDGVITGIEEFGIVNQWKDKIWVCFGTSITDNWSTNAHIGETVEPAGKYAPYLQEMGGFIPFPDPHPAQPDVTKSNNFGIAGGKMSGHILYYIRYFLHDNPNGVGIANAVQLVTIEGGVNDFASAVPLGAVGDTVPYTNALLPDSTDDGTFAGACYCAFKEAMEYAPNAVIVLLTETTGKNDIGYANYDWGRLNSLGFKQIDYINMTKAVADYVGIIVIDCGRDSMINASNPSYIVDHIHHSYLGGKQYAKTIWSKLKDIPCKITSLD